jgi:hypothetical protein
MTEDFDLSGVELPDMDDDELLMPHEREMRVALRQMVEALQQQNALLVVIAKRLGPKRLIRDEMNRIAGVMPVEE